MRNKGRMIKIILGYCALILLGSVSNAFADSIYFTTHRDPVLNDAALKRMNPDGTGLTTVLTGASYSHAVRSDPYNSTTGFPRGLAIDLVNNKLYFTDMDERSIRRADLDGSNIELLVDTGLGPILTPCGEHHGSPQGIALDVPNNQMYWADAGFGTISRANLDGSNPEIIISDSGTTEGISLDLISGKIYFGSGTETFLGEDNCVFSFFIKRANLDGSAAETLVETRARDLAVDSTAGYLYWTEQFPTNLIRRARLDGSQVETLVASGAGTFGITLHGGTTPGIYWTEDGTKLIRRAAMDGTGVQTVISGLSPVPQFITSDVQLDGILQILIDIKPGGVSNSVNPRSRGRIPVAILTTEDFDATTVNSTTVRFGQTGTEAAPARAALEDVDRDHDMDMILHFNTQETGIQCGDIETILTGETLGGQAFQGADSIRTVGCNSQRPR